MVEENAGREAPTEFIWAPLIRDDTAAAESSVEIVDNYQKLVKQLYIAR